MAKLIKNKVYRLVLLEYIVASINFTLKTTAILNKRAKLQQRYWFFGWRWKTVDVSDNIVIKDNNLIINFE